MKLKIILLTIFSFAFLGGAESSWAACSWNGNVGTAASCSNTDVSACVSDAKSKSGEVTIFLPACSDTSWSGQVAVDMAANFSSVSSLTISGSGNCALNPNGRPVSCPTNITGNGFNFVGSEGKLFRLTNLALKNISTPNEAIKINGNSKNWRFDHIRFENITSGRVFMIGGNLDTSGVSTYGVLDHNYVYHSTGHFAHVRASGGNGGNAAWAQGMRFGSADSVYIEDNTFEANTNFECITDAELGGSFVIRKNIATNAFVCMHDVAVEGRGTLGWEIYDNQFTNTYSYTSREISIRSGSGFVFNNNFTTTDPNPYYTRANDSASPIAITHYTVCDNTHSSPDNFFCDGSTGHKFCLGTKTRVIPCASDADCANESGACKEFNAVGGNGRPCRDQVGVNNNLQSRPALFWNNKRNGSYYNPVVYDSVNTRSGCDPISGTFAQAYIRSGYEYCSNASSTMPTSCGGVTTSYSPFTYPHPLISSELSDTTPPAAPTGLSVQ